MKLLLVFQEALGVERRHAARGGGGDGLTVGLVLHVACGEDAGLVAVTAGRRVPAVTM